MKKGAVIAIVIIVLVIIIGVVGYLIYKSNQKKQADAAQRQADILQAQLAQNPNMPPQQRASILEQLANLAGAIAAAKAGSGQGGTPPPYVPPGYVPPPTGDAGSPVAPYGFPLRNGSNTKNAPAGKKYVQQLQSAINAKCGKKLVPDGVFGPLTQSAATQCIGSSTVSWDQYQSYLTT